ncbi:MAG: hypothetical protein Q8S73_05220 [Deltaproteobacteria bacterium]|nr:hypothetical protein [Deltaproteobacteria bacterium]
MDAGPSADLGPGVDVGPLVDADVGVGPDAPVFVDAGVRADTGPDTGPGVFVDAGPAPMDIGAANATITGAFSTEEGITSGATVVVVDRPGATVTTVAGGQFSFVLPIGSTQTIRGSHPTGRAVQSTLVIPAGGLIEFNLEVFTNSTFADIYSMLSLTDDTTRGTLLLRFQLATGVSIEGIGATLSVSGGTRFLLTEDAVVRRDTTMGMNTTLGVMNVPTGTVTVTPVVPAGRTCTPRFGVATVRVDARTVTEIPFDCR